MNTENHYQETDLGNISLNPRGEYNPEESYEYLDLVVLKGGSYVCLAENGATITGISPESGKTTQYWQVITIPGSLTPEYIAMHDRVVNLSEQVGADAVEVRTAEQNVSGMELNVTQMQEQTRQSAEAAEQSKDSSAGYAASADASRQAAEESKQNIDAQVTGFDNHVAEKTGEAENDIEAARIAANKAIIAQQEQSVNEVARAGIEAISTAQSAAQTATEKAQAAATSEKNAAASETAAKLSEENATKMAEQVATDKEQVAYDRTAVENAKQEMTGSVTQIEQNTQGISELKGDLVNETTRATNRENEIESLFTMPTQEAVNKWLDEHPEATTTVQDHSLTVDKLVNGTLGYVTLKMFGALPGVENSQITTNAFIECVNFANQNHLDVVIENDDYYIGRVELSELNNITVRCENNGKLIFDTSNHSPYYPVISLNNCDGILFDGVNLNIGSECNGINITNSENIIFSMCNFISKNIAVYMNNVSYFKINNCTFTSTSYDSTTSDGKTAIHTINSKNGILFDNQFISWISGCEIWKNCENVDLYDNKFIDVVCIGMSIARLSNSRIHNNKIIRSTDKKSNVLPASGIEVAWCKNTLVENNELIELSIATHGDNTVSEEGLNTNIIIKNNTIDGNNRLVCGISIGGYSQNISVIQNIVKNTVASDYQSWDSVISVDTPLLNVMSNITIAGNIITHCVNGIYIVGTKGMKDIIISENNIMDAKLHGIYASHDYNTEDISKLTERIEVSKNTVSSCGRNGIHIGGKNTILVRDNTVYDIGDIGIYILSANNNPVDIFFVNNLSVRCAKNGSGQSIYIASKNTENLGNVYHKNNYGTNEMFIRSGFTITNLMDTYTNI